MTRWIRAAALAAAGLLAATGCRFEAREQEPLPPGPNFTQAKSPFADSWAIVHAIGEGTFAKRAGIADELAAVRLPAPLRIEFASGTRVPAAQQERIAAFAAKVRSDADVSLRIVGCSDPSGSAALNRRVSHQRAASVAAELSRLGIDEKRFDAVIGRGEDCAVQERAVIVTPTRAGEGHAA